MKNILLNLAPVDVDTFRIPCRPISVLKQDDRNSDTECKNMRKHTVRLYTNVSAKGSYLYHCTGWFSSSRHGIAIQCWRLVGVVADPGRDKVVLSPSLQFLLNLHRVLSEHAGHSSIVKKMGVYPAQSFFSYNHLLK